MRRLPGSVALTLALLASFALIAATPVASARPAPKASFATLPDIGLASFQNRELPHSIANDRGVDLGGIGSDLYPARRSDEYWMVTDRGPNGLIEVDGKNRRTFPVPAFDPTIVRVRVAHGKLRVVEALPLRTRAGRPVTGMSNQLTHDESPYTYDASTPLPFNPNGVDTEGLVVAPDGSFWLVEEYNPSLLHVSRHGVVLARFVPRGLGLTGTGYPVYETLPAILLTRKQNRGFEGLALSRDGRTLYTSVQSPLSNPTKAAGEASRAIRFLTISARSGKPLGEYLYRMQPVAEYEPSGVQDAMKISGMVALGGDRLLVDERTDKVAKLYVASLRRATNILGSAWDASTTLPSLEALAEVPSSVRPMRKSLLLDLSTVPGVPGKIEGIAVRGSRTVTVVSDNDFGMSDGPAAFDANGRLVDSNVETVLATITLPRGTNLR
ncbi:esterase-like activity of phytase family protein [Tenggerimyces flavus]|uniref:Esterase-like activity of phytase family protein n=1 Tax=Tenggerimyces flavus TaxID=1708749 RepID=A0ABV7YDV6_9ACTN|nr:esterase-like activity of phytase family protein [Tenggerimyces flavus]MBM7788165.1 hypothetical protein [Tenggerimyces flavus]